MRGWGRMWVWTVALAALATLPIALGWAGLPDPVATHWGVDGTPDGSTPRAWVWAIPPFVVAIGLGLGFLLRREGRPSAESVAIQGFLGGVGIWTATSIVVLNHGADTWQQAESFGILQIVALLGVGLALGWVGFLLGRRWYPPPPVVGHEGGPEIRIKGDERATWVGRVQVWWPFFVLLPFAVVFMFLPGWLQWLAPFYVILAFLFSRVEVTVDRQGLGVRLAGSITVRRISVNKVVSARAIDLEPTEWAGWGYRVVPGGSAVVLRRGPAIEVALTDDRRFAVTVDDAITGAALLNGLVSQESGQA